MQDIFKRAVLHVLDWEGGYVNHPFDPGGPTNMGITKRTLEDYLGKPVSTEKLREMSDVTAMDIYKKNYWDKIKADDLPEPIAVLLFDAAVNSGPGNAVKALQRALNDVFRDLTLKVDGLLGPRTLKKVRQADLDKLIDEFVVRRGLFYGALQTFRKFGLGWARRLVSTARLAHSVNTEIQADLTIGPKRVEPKTEIRRHFLNDGTIQVFGSFFRLWGGWATAAHVIDESNGKVPDFAPGDLLKWNAHELDAALIGCQLPAAPPAPVHEGQRVVIAGFPAGSKKLSRREGQIHMQRDFPRSWIVAFDDGQDPVVVGMSGGCAYDAETGAPVGILVTRNHTADIDGDADLDESCDIVSLREVYLTATAPEPAMV